MSTVRIERRHDLGEQRIRAIAERLAADLEAEYGGTYHWQGSVLHFDRPGIAGTLRVGGNRLELRLRLGLMLRPLGGRIESIAARRMDELLADPPAADPSGAGA